MELLEETAEGHLVYLGCVIGHQSLVMSASFSIQLDEEVSRSHLDAHGSKLTKFFEESANNESVCNESVYEESVYFVIVYEGAGVESKRANFYYIIQKNICQKLIIQTDECFVNLCWK